MVKGQRLSDRATQWVPEDMRKIPPLCKLAKVTIKCVIHCTVPQKYNFFNVLYYPYLCLL